MNPAPAHLEAKLRFGWDFTVGQIAAMIAGILIGFAWANWLSPLHGLGGVVSGVYIGGLPVAAGFVASQTEFDLWALLLAAVRWRRAEGRFLPGAGPLTGYVVLVDPDRAYPEPAQLDLFATGALWDGSGPEDEQRAGER